MKIPGGIVNRCLCHNVTLFHNFKFNISNTTFRNISATSYILKTKKETAGDEIPKTKSKSKDESKSKDDLIQIISDDPIKLSDTNSKGLYKNYWM